MTDRPRIDLIRYIPAAVLVAGVIASAAVSQFQIGAHAEELADNAASIDENEEDIEAIQRLLIERQGQQRLELQRIETEQKAQGRSLDQILRLLEQLNQSAPPR